MQSISARFLKGLEKYNLSFEEIDSGDWKYCGGSQGRHRKYFQLVFPYREEPDHVSSCICEHRISENCYITNGDDILTLGNCCIKRFIPKSTRTCERCGEPHRNRVVNRCKECRKGVCDKCDNPCRPPYKICYGCFTKR